MALALEEAKRAEGRTHPNPAVGAVLVKGGRVVARGFHARAGAPHAEVVALGRAGAKAKGATLYSTLEPCDHFGRTPPCTQAILAAGVARVVFASSDPNPLVNGRGVRRLRRAGVCVQAGVLAEEADRLNRPFLKVMRTGLPFVTLKMASTLDGKLAAQGGDSRWVTGEAARLKVHQLRDRVDAILVGAGTVAADDPALTTRLGKGKKGRNPVRVVLDASLETSPLARVWDVKGQGRAIAVTMLDHDHPRARALAERGVELLTVPAQGARLDLDASLKKLAALGLLHVLVEGGSLVAASLLQAELVDELWLFLAPKVIGAEGVTWSGPLGRARMADALVVQGATLEPVGPDWLLRGVPTAASRAGSPRRR